MSRPLSGRFLLRVQSTTHGQLRDLARAQGLSLNALCVKLLTDALTPNLGTTPLSGHQVLLELLQRFESCGTALSGAVLFGSAARGELRPESDVDLLLVLPSTTPLRRGLYRQWDAIMTNVHLPHEINAHFVHLPLTPEKAGGLWLEVALDGLVLCDPSGQVAAKLSELRREIADQRFIRRVVHGQPYWKRTA